MATSPYLPVAQEVQALVPDASELYEPATHAVHTADVGEAATLPYAPAAHAVHTSEEDTVAASLYLPLAHAVHTRDVDAAAKLP